ncbi:MAG: thioether cross-link-forming SCIFF peptide maturase [Bacteroidota bacterium]
MSSDQHLFKLFGRNFLLDVPTNSLLEIDEEARLALHGSEAAPAEVAEEIAALRQRGLLLPDSRRAVPERAGAAGWLKALCLHVAHDCNLRCTYCFAGSGSFGGTRGIMPAEIGQAAIDLLLARSGPVRQLEVDFFGGEPLLAMESVRRVVAYGRERAAALGKRINFTLTTNAVALSEEKLAFLNENGLSLVLSLDGRPEVHNRFRPAANGRGSYADAVAGITKVVASRAGANYYVRGTFTRANLDFVADVRHLLALGFERLSLEPVVALPGEDYALREEDLPLVEAEYERLAGLYLERARAGRPFTFFHFAVDLDQGPCLGKRLSGCGAGHRYLAVTPGGELYPCHQFVGRPGYLLGDVARGITRADLSETFAGADIYHKKGCLDCWARYFCGGGCHANADLHHGTIFTPDESGCRLLRKRLECALGIQAVLARGLEAS